MAVKVLKSVSLSEVYLNENPFVIAALYQFVELENVEKVREEIYNVLFEAGMLGTILLGVEGMNGTVCGSREGVDKFYEYLSQSRYFNNIEVKETYYSQHVFEKLKVKVKEEIVTFRTGCELNFGHYVTPVEWAEFIAKPDVVMIDTRNDYEFAIGTFRGAINPQTNNFREFADWFKVNAGMFKGKKVAMFCTGGVRCEKSTSFLRSEGFEEVYHLKGGIIGYFLETRNKSCAWQGDCFVFDNRVIINDKGEGV